MATGDPQASGQGEAALKKYRKGVRDLGRSLLVLAVFQIVVGGAILAIQFEPVIAALVGGMAAVNLVLGLLLLRNRSWANHLVAVWSVLLLATSRLGIGTQGEQQPAGSNLGGCLGL